MKGLIALLAVTFFAVVLAVIVGTGSGKATADPLTGKPVLPELGPRLAEVGRLTLVHGDDKTTLMRDNGRWLVEEKGGYPADLVKLRQVLLGLAELRYVEPKTQKAQYYPRLEVEDAGKKDAKSTLVTASDEKGSLLGEVITGKHRVDQLGGGDDGVYVRKPGNAQSWLARGTLDLPADVTAWLDRKLVDLPEAKLKEIVLTGADGATLTIARDKPDEMFRLAELPKDKKLKSDPFSDIGDALRGLDLTDVRPAKFFDFPKDGVTHARYISFDGLTVSLDLVEKDGADWARFSASGSGAAAKEGTDLNAGFANWVYAIPSFKAKALRTKLADLVEAPKGS